MKATFWQRGEAIDYVNDTTDVIEANTIIDLTTRIGIAGMPINPGETGSLHVSGVWEIEKASGETFDLGDEVKYSATGMSASGTTPAGWCIKKAEAADKTVFVKLLG